MAALHSVCIAPAPHHPDASPADDLPTHLMRVLECWCQGTNLSHRAILALGLVAEGFGYHEVALRLRCDRYRAMRLCETARRAVVSRARDCSPDPRARAALTLYLEGAGVEWVALVLGVTPDRVPLGLGKAVREAFGEARSTRAEVLDCLREERTRRGRRDPNKHAPR